MTVTFVTLALAVDAPGKFAEAWIAEVNSWPFWSTLTRWATGGVGSKNAVQLAVISATAEPPAAADGDAEALAGAEVAVGELGDEPGVELELEPLLPHAAMLVLRAHSSMISGIEVRIFTQAFSSFPLVLAMLCLTLTSAWRRGRARRSAFPEVPARTPGTPGPAPRLPRPAAPHGTARRPP